ncbi:MULTISPECIES: hypothetical protein [unclassified Corynebacterium]|uniref:hypothetical protein n=1 Tax=unclassified Corynebacterium TaxID=2624378 RepID=UPI0026505148|nr:MULTISPECIES: hypothetical protein [unclassified Corynebacterium]MDN8594781.1 hypothetical protein [Corynebacterium sp. P4_F2]WKK56369.1 hypothetical protein QYR03_03920 [Corynebacterium sp. P4-C1]WKK63801.1 hypothetical protein QYR04_02530 [Corynebacterium sp. P8-C1]
MKMKYFFNADTARMLGEQLGIDGDEYAAWVAQRVDDLEIKDRVGVFARGLRDRLPADYGEAVAAIVDKLGPELAEGEGYFNHAFHLWPVSRYIEDYGLDDPSLSLDAIEALTRAFTGEWAVRPYLTHYPALTMERVEEWSRSTSHNVRRLSTEGIRPRLPWAPVHRPFLDDSAPIIPVLDRLYADTSLYVRTSVANNLNDIARTHPLLAVATAERWLAETPSPEVTWVAERGLRGLIRQGDPAALATVGFAATDNIQLVSAAFPPRVAVGEKSELTARVVNASDEPRDILVDYRVHFLKKNGTHRPTTFRLGRLTLAPGEERDLVKRHSFAVTSTRTLYPGTHAVSVVVNGVESEPISFELVG